VLAGTAGPTDPMDDLRISTQRLDLVAATRTLLELELSDAVRWRAMLNADVPADWPPEHWDEPAIRYTINHMLIHDADVGWAAWYVLLRGAGDRPTLIGGAGLKGRPSTDGTIEIGYGTVPSFQRRGYATEACRGLIDWACRHAAVRRVTAETLPHLQPSLRVMQKLGMTLIGPGSEAGVIRYGMTLPERSDDDAAPATPFLPDRTAPPQSTPPLD
jgi:RimJ/RimL family protein N-acetyltransferase